MNEKEPEHKVLYTKENFIEKFKEYEKRCTKNPHVICLSVISKLQNNVKNLKIDPKEQSWFLLMLAPDEKNTQHKNFDLTILIEHIDDSICWTRADPDYVYNELYHIVDSLKRKP